ncbi:cell wall-binding repeat-containing protein [Clostridium sp.]|uniref:cell wall-binding repeat-containing protein n=1 Tax=Clostridium sp. TaxID=1506 RepID=UPI0032170BEF
MRKIKKRRKSKIIKIGITFIVIIIILGSKEFIKTKIKLYGVNGNKNESLMNLNNTFTKNRIYEKSEIETSVEIAKSGWKKSDVVIVSNKSCIKEGLIALPLSKKYNAPILLSESEGLNNNVRKQIEELETKIIIIIGDKELISTDIEDELIKKKLEVVRIKGVDITDFSINVAKEIDNSNRYIISTGKNMNEIMKLSSVSMSEQIPIIISENYLSAYRFLRSKGSATCYFAGRNNKFDAIFYGLNKKDADGLSLLEHKDYNGLMSKKSNLKFTNIVLASSKNFASMLCGQAMCGVLNYPLIPIEENTINPYTEKFLLKNIKGINNVIAIGSENDISDDLMKTSNWGKTYCNAKKPLVTPTYDGSNQAVHPKVMYEKNGWNGYKYWMGLTPYPNGNDDYENPQILVSNDGIEYNYLSGVNKPLDIPIDVNTGGHYSDITICLVDNILEVYFRHNPSRKDGNGANNSENNVYVMKSKDGLNWTDKELVLDTNTFSKKYDYVSPIVIYDNNKYKIWFSNYSRDLYYTETTDWKNFKEVETCNFKDKPLNFSLWHNDVIKTELGYEVVINGYNDNESGKQSLYYTISKDGINFAPLKKMLDVSPEEGAFDNGTLYKSSLVKVEDKYLLYYSAKSKTGMWRIGLAENKNKLISVN